MRVHRSPLSRRGGRLLVADNPAAAAAVRLRKLPLEGSGRGASNAPHTGAKHSRSCTPRAKQRARGATLDVIG